MKKILSIVLIIISLALAQSGFAQSAINKNSFFNSMASGNSKQIDAQLAALKSVSGSDREAFEGALLMRKAGTLTIPAKKLSMFKLGHKKLESAISKNPGNIEYKFLRLMVQENAPRSLGYYKTISQDSKFVKDSFKNLPLATQNSVVSYSKKSKSLAGAF